ncbi:methyltransferase domain-containing protein [Intrasporangium sp. DVR]|uniref:class I SAM-dependent methyltransferase n=1 Tax=Intrasporangium sp. DVR TaxID=3127867 RepID=UPI00313A4DD9
MTTTTPVEPIDQSPRGTDTADEVAGRLLDVLNDGSIAVLASLGHRLGLFDTLLALPPATSQQVSDAAGLDERYVREWLGGVATAGFVDYDPVARTYALRPDHAPFLTGASPDNLARTLQYVTLMGEVVPKVAEAFRSGGGLTYADYPGFHEIQAADTGAVLDLALVDLILPWTGATDRLRAGIDVADVGCGSGHAVNLLARAFPASRFTGIDFEPDAIGAARAEAAAWGLTNATYLVADAAAEASPAAYDLITAFDTIHDQAHPAKVLANIYAALRPAGTFLMGDIDAATRLEDNLDLPWASFLYAVSTTHCMSVSLAQGGDGLGTVWGVERAERMLREAGFATVETHRLEENPFNVYFVARA